MAVCVGFVDLLFYFRFVCRPRHMVGQVVVGNGQLVLAYANKNVVLRLDMETTREEGGM